MAKARSKTKTKSKSRRKTQAKRGAKSKSKGARKITAKAKGRSKAKGARKMIRAQATRAMRTSRDASAPAKSKAKTKRTPPAAFMKPVQPDSALAAVVGSNAIPRTEITKKLWAYIK
ncbi:MAG: SWIB/MDM2 domain-containing protein, partial [bacterium]